MRTERVHAAIQRCHGAGYAIRRRDGEWQVKPAADPWDGPTTYYTTDLDDAVATAEAEATRSTAEPKAACPRCNATCQTKEHFTQATRTEPSQLLGRFGYCFNCDTYWRTDAQSTR